MQEVNLAVYSKLALAILSVVTTEVYSTAMVLMQSTVPSSVYLSFSSAVKRDVEHDE